MILIKNAIINRNSNQTNICDIKIENSIITSIEQDINVSDNYTIIDASHKLVLPSFIDIHCHLRDMEQSASEDISSGTKAAAAGGYTHVVSMANTKPVIDSVDILQKYQNLIKSQAVVNVLPLASLTKELKGTELVDLYQLINSGVIGFSDDGKPYYNKRVLYNALMLTRNEPAIIISHAEDLDLSCGGDVNNSAQAFKLGLNSIPEVSEISTIASEIEIVRTTKSKIHFSHVSLGQSLKLIEQAKSDGVNITCDITPHHLCLDDSLIQTYNTSFKMNPPLRNKSDREFLVQSIRNGIVDCIGTDHAPHNSTLKNCGFNSAAFGVTGLETAFSLCYETLVLGSVIDMSRLITLFNDNPAKILGINKNVISIGSKANLVIFDPNEKWYLKNHLSKSSNSPFVNKKLHGKISCTICDGKVVYQK